MMQKIMPCQGCGQVLMCISHDKIKFYCNRCLPYYVRGFIHPIAKIQNNSQPATQVADVKPVETVTNQPKTTVSKTTPGKGNVSKK